MCKVVFNRIGDSFCRLQRSCYHRAMHRARWLAVPVCAAALALYLRTLAPSVAFLFDDSLEFQLVGYRLAVAHPTGYPLYTLLLKLFSFLPFGDVAYRANLLSAVCAALAVAIVYLAALQLTQSVLASLVAALALAVSPVFWSQAVIAEVYALNALFVAALIYGAIVGRWSARRLPLLALLYGLALTHHRTVLLMAPALVGFLILDLRSLIEKSKSKNLQPQPIERQRSKILLCLLAPLLLYVYIPLRGAVGSLDGTYQNTTDGFLRWILASDYNIFITQNPFSENRDALFFVNLFLNQFGALGVVLALTGLIALFVRRWPEDGHPSTTGRPSSVRDVPSAIFLASAFLAYLVFVLVYRVPDVAVFAIPAFLFEALLIGAGAHALWQVGGRTRVLVRPLLLIVLALNFLSLIPAAFAANDLSQATGVRDYGRDIMAQHFPANSTLVGILGEMTLVRYFQDTEGPQPELHTVAADRDDERLSAIERELQAGRATFTTRALNGLPERYALGAFGPLVRVWPEPQHETLPASAPLVDTIRYHVDAISQPQPQLVRVQLTWQPESPLTSDLKVSARLLDGETLRAQHDDWPVHNAYHSVFWRPGETIADVYDVLLPPDMASAGLRVLLIVYRADSGAEVGRIDAGSLN
jgi:hypothetical protein